MTTIRIFGVFVMGSLAGFGIALLTCVAHLYYAKVLVGFSPINSFLVGVVLLTLGCFGCVAVARAGKTWRLRTVVGTIMIVAVLLGVVVEVRRRSREFWGRYVQHQAQANALNAQYQLARLDPRLTKQAMASIQTLADWHRSMALRFYKASNYPWMPLDPGPPEP